MSGVRLGAAALLLAAVALASPARAEVVLGVFAPAAPLENTEARLALGTALAAHLATAVPQGGKVRPRVFVRISEFEKAKDLALVLVDSTYVSSAPTSWRMLARSPDMAWQLVARKGIDSVASLLRQPQRRLSVATGGSDALAARIADGLLRGEARALFTGIAQAPDSVSALAALALGKVDCVLVPRETPLMPSGATVILSLDAEPIPGMVLMSTGQLDDEQRRSFAELAPSFRGAAPVPSLFAADAKTREAIVQRLAVSARRGPMAASPLRALVGRLLVDPVASIPLPSPVEFVVTPSAAPTAPSTPTAN